MFNETNLVGIFIIQFTNNITGDIFLTLLTIFLFIFMFFLAMRIPIELTAILIVPLLIIYMSEGGAGWETITGAILLYLGVMFGRYFMR